MVASGELRGDTLLRSGDVEGARQALVETVKRAPGDAGARMFLWQLLAVCGEWDRAATQLRALAQISPAAQMLAAVYGQAMTAEKARAAAYAGAAAFTVLVPSSDWIGVLARALSAQAAGDVDAAERLRDEAFDAAGETPGAVDGERFLWIADADSRLGPCFEAVLGDRWGLVPFEAVVRISTEGPQDLRDLVWAPVQLHLRSGQSAAALLPVRYPGSEAGPTAARLARETVWDAGPGGDQPAGQRLWTTDTDLEIGILGFRELVMA